MGAIKTTTGKIWTEGNQIDFSVGNNDGSNIIMYMYGNDAEPFNNLFSIDGKLEAIQKSFVITHPTKTGKKLEYSSVESPYVGIRLTGKESITKKEVVVELPEYMHALIHNNKGINIQITNIGHDKILFVKEIDIKHNLFIIGVKRMFYGTKLDFFWTFTGIRKDVPELKVER